MRDQLPELAVSVCPCTAVPEIVGGDVFRGGPPAARAEGSVPTSPPTANAAAAAYATFFGFTVLVLTDRPQFSLLPRARLYAIGGAK